MLQFCDGFDSYTSIADVPQKWSDFRIDNFVLSQPITLQWDNWLWVANEGVNLGGCLKHTGAAGERIGRPIRRTNNNVSQDLVFREIIWFKIAGPPTVRVPFIEWIYQDAGLFVADTFWRYALDIDTNGFLIQRKRLSPTVTQIDEWTGALNVCDNAWHCMERFSKGYSPYAYRLAIDGVDLVNDIVSSTLPAGRLNYFSLLSLGVTMWIDDLIIWDDNGSNPVVWADGSSMDETAFEFDGDWWFSMGYAAGVDVNSDTNNFPEAGQGDLYGWLGPKQITTLRPTSTDISSFELVGAPSRAAALDDIAHDGDTSYVVDSVAGEREIYNLEDFPHALAISAVALNYQAKLEGHGSIVFTPESLQGVDSLLGYRRRLVGHFDFEPDGVNLVDNGGPGFVDTTGWALTSTVNADLDVSAGNLRINKHTTGVPIPQANYTLLDLIPMALYRVKCKNAVTSTQSFRMAISNRLAPQFDPSRLTPPGTTYEFVFVAGYVAPILNFIYGASSSSVGECHLEYVSVELILPEFQYKLYQWAMPVNPTGEVAWTQASLDSAKFGMRISL